VKARLFINGFFLGEITYEHPKLNGKTVVLPEKEPRSAGQVQVLISDEENRNHWIACQTLERLY